MKSEPHFGQKGSKPMFISQDAQLIALTHRIYTFCGQNETGDSPSRWIGEIEDMGYEVSIYRSRRAVVVRRNRTASS